MRSFPEADWKKLRALRGKALSRFCRRALDTVRETLAEVNPDENAHRAFLDVYSSVVSEDEDLGFLFNDWRRSNALVTLANWVEAGIVEDEEVDAFSEETRSRVFAVLNLRETR